jgi:hypothetical protein
MSGIKPQSNAQTYFVFCVGQSIPIINAFKVSMTSQGVTVKPLMGKYKGQPEYSFVASMDDYNIIAPWLDEEESILHIHSFNSSGEPRATLRYLKEGRTEHLGRMVQVTRDEAIHLDSYTYDPWYNLYFICR